MNFRNKLLASSLIISVASLSSPVLAQVAPEPGPDTDEDTTVSAPAPESGPGDRIIVTGSRIRTDTFNSPSPIQILDAELAQKVGVTTATELLQRAPVANGAQIDSSLNTSSGNSNASEAPPTGGTGSSNIDLRGLGVERTLVMVNGRRLGSTGVRGAPAQPDISLLPLSMIERIDVVTEGASSIYGADAVAGVVNVILKDDFEGLEMTGGVQVPQNGGGEIVQLGATIGTSGDRARIMAGVEFYNRQRVAVGQRDFTSSGNRSIEVGPNGEIYDIFVDGNFDNTILDVTGSTPGGQVFFFFTPGRSDTGVANFSSFNGLPPLPANARDFGTSTNFIYFPFYGDSDDNNQADLVQPLKRLSFVANGSYDIFPEHNARAYFEAYYFEREQFIQSVGEQLFPDIPAMIPVIDNIQGSPTFGFATGATVDNPLNPFNFNAVPILTLDDYSQDFNVNVDQIRFVAGIQSDISGDWFEDRGWGIDISWSYDRGVGFVSQQVLNEERLLAATQGVYQGTDGNVYCGQILREQDGGFFSLQDCPLINFFNESFYTGGPNGEGVFENQAQRDYLLGNRTNRTVTEQTIYAAYINGGLFDIPFGGEVAFAAGYEHRDDQIDSQNSFLGVVGGNASENPLAEGETRGRRNLDEVFAEIRIPLIEDKPFVDTFLVEGAVRYTNESNFGGQETYRVRALYKPVDWIQLSGSYGTSFRAPNLREQFLASQGGGIGGGLDPCIEQNIDVAQNQDPNDPAYLNLLANCQAQGVLFNTDIDGDGDLDTLLGSTGITTIPTSTGGNANLLPETSDSYTATLSISPPISPVFDIDLAVSYYKIDIQNSVRNLGAATIIGRCLGDQNFPNLTSPFCGFITRDANATPSARLIQNVQAGFVNIGQDNAEGLDFNARLGTNFADLFGGPNVDFFVAAAASYLLKRETQVFADDPVQELEGKFGLDASGLPFSFPKWKGQMTTGIEIGNFELITQLNYIGKQEFINAALLVENANPFFVDSTGTRVLSRNFGTNIGSWIYQSISAGYDFNDELRITVGVNNVWDKEPPIVDRSIAPQRQNAVTSSGYDFVGRTLFVNARTQF